MLSSVYFKGHHVRSNTQFLNYKQNITPQKENADYQKWVKLNTMSKNRLQHYFYVLKTSAIMHRVWVFLLWDEVQVCVEYSFIIYIIATSKIGQVLRVYGASAMKNLPSKRTNMKGRADRI